MRNLRAAACKRMHKLDRDLQTAPLARMILTKPPVRRATHPLREATGNLDEFRIRRRDLIGGVIHEYGQAAGPWTRFGVTSGGVVTSAPWVPSVATAAEGLGGAG
jgi:hypothetical protein